jgi:hypothetical protein
MSYREGKRRDMTDALSVPSLFGLRRQHSVKWRPAVSG